MAEKLTVPECADSCPPEETSTLELIRFVVPTVGGWISSEMMSVIDTAIVGSGSATELAALGPATMLTDSGAYLFFWLNVATTSLFATALAAGKTGEAYDTLSDALWCALACGIFMTLVMAFFGRSLLVAICSSAPEVVPAAYKYLSIRLLGLPAFMAGMVLQAACLGARDSLSPLIVLVSSGLLNLVLDIYLVTKLGMGIGGAAWATLASQLLQTALLAFIVQRKRAKAGAGDSWLLVRPGLPEPKRLLKFVTFAGPIFLVLLGKISCYNAMTLGATANGIVALAAHQAMISVFFLGCKFGDAISQTSQTYLPACYDPGADGAAARPPARAQRLSARLLRLSTVLGAIVSLLAFAFITRLPTIFTRDIAVLSAMRGCAPLLFVALLLHATCMCCEGLLLGSRELKFLSKAYIANVGVFLSALYMITQRRLGLQAVWKALAAFQLVRIITFALRLRTVGLAFTRDADAAEREE